MTAEECFHILNLPAGATAQEIRRSYLDLARVWHPDRFESDPRLRKVAEDRLRQINEAYSALKTSDFDRPVVRPKPAAAKPKLPRRSVARAACVAAIVIVPILFAMKIIPLLRVPALAADARAMRPRVLEPMAILDRSSDYQVAVDTLNDWARGEVVDLWSSAAHPYKAPVSAPSAGSGSHKTYKRAIQPVASGPLLENGSDLIPAGRQSGASELHVLNDTALEAVVFLLKNGRTTVRAMYVRPNQDASLRSVPAGVYTVHVELGNELDVNRLRFQHANRTLPRFGPFEFWEIVSSDKSWNKRYEIKLNIEPQP